MTSHVKLALFVLFYQNIDHQPINMKTKTFKHYETIRMDCFILKKKYFDILYCKSYIYELFCYFEQKFKEKEDINKSRGSP